VPGNGNAGDLPLDMRLTPEELGHATGSRAYFWLVCPVTPTTSR
jgi:hypothetical protein